MITITIFDKYSSRFAGESFDNSQEEDVREFVNNIPFDFFKRSTLGVQYDGEIENEEFLQFLESL